MAAIYPAFTGKAGGPASIHPLTSASDVDVSRRMPAGVRNENAKNMSPTLDSCLSV